MDNNNFGILFKEIRERKGFKQGKVAEGIVSVQFLRRFEKGESDIKLSNFYQLLNRINVSFDEFMYELEVESIDYITEELEKKFDRIIIKSDLISLDALIKEFYETYDSTRDSKYLQYYIIARIVYNSYFGSNYKIETEYLFSYLNQCETWGRHEYFIANYSVDVFNDKQLYNLGKLSFYSGVENRTTRHFAFDFIFHICSELIKRDFDKEAIEIINLFKDKVNLEPILQFLSFNVAFVFLENILEGKKGNQKGFENCISMMSFLSETVGYVEYANKMHKYYSYFYSKYGQI